MGFSRTDDGAYRKRTTHEWTRLGHDQVRLELLATERSRVEIREGQPICGIGEWRQWTRTCIARLVRPCLEVHRLGRADADQDPQHLNTGCSLRHGRIKAVSSLFNCRHMKRCSIGDGLNVLVGMQVGISSGNRCMRTCKQIWHSLSERASGTEVRA